jgi:3-deoxy-manno-octulosonate cytidylyltransferase (CMP-KDO synthetase)
MRRTIAIIPARMGSSRFPGKPLALILGRPMIEHVFRRVSRCEILDAVYIATCDDEIRSAVENFGGKVIMTSASHVRASDRVAEAADRIEAAGEPASDIVVMIQGDEPMITLEMIQTAVAPMLRDPEIPCVNLVHRIVSHEEYVDPNTIKVVMNLTGDALYFSRAPIPAIDFAGQNDLPVFKQVCVIPFRREFLHHFAQLAATPLENVESIDMLRALEHNYKVRLVETDVDTHAVDTLEDLLLVESLIQSRCSNRLPFRRRAQ